MENKTNREFNRLGYLKTVVNQLIHKPTAESIEKVYSQLLESLNKNVDAERFNINQQKRKILENCRDIFKTASVREAIADAKNQGLSSSDIVNIIVRKYSERALGDNKRQYDMSKLSANGMLSSIILPDGTAKKDVSYRPENNGFCVNLQDMNGNRISIQIIGTLSYNTIASSEYIYKFRISRLFDDSTMSTYEIFSNIDLNKLTTDKSYCDVVVNELLSINNIELSSADGYIGELSTTYNSQSPLKPGQEQFEESDDKTKLYYYRYQISPEHALYYDCERFEAIKAYNEQEKQIKSHTCVDDER